MSRWQIINRSISSDDFTLRCPRCSEAMRTSPMMIERMWEGIPRVDVGPKPTIRCVSCGYDPHLPGPSDTEKDREHYGW